MSGNGPRDTELERAWRDAPRDEPPRSLDDAILARAREAVAPRKAEPPSELWPLAHPRSWLMRWRVPVAVAATLVVSGTVTLMVYETGVEEPAPVVTDRVLRKAEPPPVPTAPSGLAKQKEAAPSVSATPAPSVDATQRSTDIAKPPSPAAKRETQPAEERRAQPEAPMTTTPSVESGRVATPEPKRAEAALSASREAPVPAPAPAPPTERAQAPGAAGAVAPAAPRAMPAPMAAPPPPAPQASPRDNAVLEKRDESSEAAPATRAKAAAFATPEAYVERIRELKRAGREAEARELLDELKRRFPAFELPDDLKPAR